MQIGDERAAEPAPAPTNEAVLAAKSRADMTDEEKKALKEAKAARKAAEKAEKAARKAASAAAAAAAVAATADLTSAVSFLSVSEPPAQTFGPYAVVQGACGAAGSGRVFSPLPQLEAFAAAHPGEQVWVRARVHKCDVRGAFAFLTLRKGLHSVQAVVVNDKAMLKWVKKSLTAESVVDVCATPVAPEAGAVQKCSVQNVELAVTRLYVVSASDEKLPMTLDDAARPLSDDNPTMILAEAEEGVDVGGDKTHPTVTRDTRLDNRVMDLRVAPHGSMLRLQSGVCQLFREHLSSKGFTEIHTPKLISGASEGGADVFKTDYFGRPACLAQSPQLYKQMAICGDMARVFEVGPVFRAEKSDTHRHLCEFTGLDIEMEIFEHYTEVLDVLDEMFVAIFDGLEDCYAEELRAVRAKWDVPKFVYKSTGARNLRLDWPEAIAMIREAGTEIDDFEDLSTEKEKLLGKLVKEKYGTDFFMLLRFPSAIRPFYTMTDPMDANYSNSFDIFMRGEEIVSGAQRIHDLDMLKARAVAMLGEEGVESIAGYMDAFRYGTWPHGGAGVGLERVVMLYLAVGNIRECTMFPRDPKRLTP
jgi:aspartyl-tRNA synthetase